MAVLPSLPDGAPLPGEDLLLELVDLGLSGEPGETPEARIEHLGAAVPKLEELAAREEAILERLQRLLSAQQTAILDPTWAPTMAHLKSLGQRRVEIEERLGPLVRELTIGRGSLERLEEFLESPDPVIAPALGVSLAAVLDLDEAPRSSEALGSLREELAARLAELQGEVDALGARAAVLDDEITRLSG